MARARDLELTDALLLGCTPDGWLSAALADQETLLLDHAECEKKAAASALSLLHRYGNDGALVDAASRIAREELRHFELVRHYLRARGVVQRTLTPSRYAAALKAHVRAHEPARLLDTLLIAAFIEARSLERFARIVDATDDVGLAQFYRRLMASEARHARGFLRLAEQRSSKLEMQLRIDTLRPLEQLLIDTPDTLLRFHSGPPSSAIDRRSN